MLFPVRRSESLWYFSKHADLGVNTIKLLPGALCKWFYLKCANGLTPGLNKNCIKGIASTKSSCFLNFSKSRQHIQLIGCFKRSVKENIIISPCLPMSGLPKGQQPETC